MSYSAFFYGSLMSEIVLLRATASEYDKTLKLKSIQLRSTLLKGHKRFSLTGEDYPAVIQTGDEHDSVNGILCQRLELKDINALDCFEVEDYKRVPIQVSTINDNTSIYTEVYIWSGDRDLLVGKEWCFDYVVNSGKEQKWLDERCEFYNVDNLPIT